MRPITQYDRLRALVRNPEYLKDLQEIQKGFSLKKRIEFFNKWNLDDVIITPEMVEKYPAEVWEAHPIFKDRPIKIKFNRNYLKPITKEFIYQGEPKKHPGISDKVIFMEYDWTDYFKKTHNILTFEIDITKNLDEITHFIKSIVRLYRQYIPETTRKNIDYKIDRFQVWDEYQSLRSFRKIANKDDVDEDTVRKAWYRAFEDIMGEKFDPQKHNRNKLTKEQLKKTCDKCDERDTCKEPCDDVLSYIKQDEVKRKERSFSEIYNDEPSFL